MELRFKYWLSTYLLLSATRLVTFGIATASIPKGHFSQNIYRVPNAQVLAAHRGVNQSQTLRVAVDDGQRQSIKYIHLDSTASSAGGLAKSKECLVDLPLLPAGDWNEAYIHLKWDTTMPVVTSVAWTRSTGILGSDWHPRKIDYFEFTSIETLQQDRMQVVTHPDFDGPVLIKIASFPWEIPSMEREATIYRRLHGSGVTPEFLGYVTEGHRAIGFIAEYIPETLSTRDGKMRSCIASLHSLHQRGFAHQDAHDGNCLVRGNGSAVLIDFELSVETNQDTDFEEDLNTMERCIWSKYGLH
jgi:serine/threonine protein kinase